MDKSYRERLKEEGAERRQQQKKRIFAVVVLLVILVGAAWWYLGRDGDRRAQTAVEPSQTTRQQEAAAVRQDQPQTSVKPAAKETAAVQAAYTILIDKSVYKLYLLQGDKTLQSWDVAVGAKPGQKQRAGDMTTPDGNFEVDEILEASQWAHDFGDGKGEIKGAYGPKFISLVTGWDGIGIHGTHAPESIGTMASEGCVRMHNEDLLELLPYVKVGTKVEIRE